MSYGFAYPKVKGGNGSLGELKTYEINAFLEMLSEGTRAVVPEGMYLRPDDSIETKSGFYPLRFSSEGYIRSSDLGLNGDEPSRAFEFEYMFGPTWHGGIDERVRIRYQRLSNDKYDPSKPEIYTIVRRYDDNGNEVPYATNPDFPWDEPYYLQYDTDGYLRAGGGGTVIPIGGHPGFSHINMFSHDPITGNVVYADYADSSSDMEWVAYTYNETSKTFTQRATMREYTRGYNISAWNGRIYACVDNNVYIRDPVTHQLFKSVDVPALSVTNAIAPVGPTQFYVTHWSNGDIFYYNGSALTNLQGQQVDTSNEDLYGFADSGSHYYLITFAGAYNASTGRRLVIYKVDPNSPTALQVLHSGTSDWYQRVESIHQVAPRERAIHFNNKLYFAGRSSTYGYGLMEYDILNDTIQLVAPNSNNTFTHDSGRVQYHDGFAYGIGDSVIQKVDLKTYDTTLTSIAVSRYYGTFDVPRSYIAYAGNYYGSSTSPRLWTTAERTSYIGQPSIMDIDFRKYLFEYSGAPRKYRFYLYVNGTAQFIEFEKPDPNDAYHYYVTVVLNGDVRGFKSRIT